jgi:hypothetical protein
VTVRFYIDPATAEPHIHGHAVLEEEVEDPRPNPGLCVCYNGVRTRREGPKSSAASPEAVITEKAMKKLNRFPVGWNEARVRRVLAHYEGQSDTEAVADDEAAYRSTTSTVMKIPVKLVPAVRALLAKRRAS